MGASTDDEIFGLRGGNQAELFIQHATIFRGKLQVKFGDLDSIYLLELLAAAEKVQLVVTFLSDRIEGKIYLIESAIGELFAANLQS